MPCDAVRPCRTAEDLAELAGSCNRKILDLEERAERNDAELQKGAERQRGPRNHREAPSNDEGWVDIL